MTAIPDPNPGDRPPPTTQPPTVLRRLARQPFVQASMAGMLLGLADVLSSDGAGWVLFAYFWAGAILGSVHAGRAWPCWPPLGASLYAAHLAAITCGRGPPYVEPSIQAARQTLWLVFPTGLGLALGSATRWAAAALGWPRPPVRLAPRTTRGLLASVAGIGIALGVLRWVAFDSARFMPRATMRAASGRSAPA